MLPLEDPVNSECTNLDWIAFICLAVYILVHDFLEIQVVQVHLIGALNTCDVLVHQIWILRNLQDLFFFHHEALDQTLFEEIGKHLSLYKLGKDISKELS